MNWYERHTERELRGRKVRTLRPMRNGHATVPAGTIGTITRKFGGVNVDFDPCGTCGIGVVMSRVDAASLELLPKEVPAC